MNVEKILATVAFIFIILALCIIVNTPPCTGYEISIYEAYSPYFWFLLLGIITCGVAILLYQAFAEKESKYWLVGLIIVIFANTIFLLLPKLRGYVLYGRGDTLTHLGYIKDILDTGHVGGSNYYPIIHLLGTILIQVAGLSLENIPFLFYIFFSGMYIVNMGFLARSTAKHFSQVLFIVAFSSPLIYSFLHVTIHPATFSLFMVPCLLCVYQNREQLPYYHRQNTVLLLLLAFSITFFHPVTTLFVIVIFLTFGFAHTLDSRFLRKKTPESIQYKCVGKNFLGITLILFIAFFIWYFSYSSIQRSFKVIYDWLFYQIGTPLIQTTLEPLAEAGLTPLQTFELFMNRYGAISLLLLISAIASIFVLGKSLSRKRDIEPMKFIYAILFLISFFIGILMLSGYFVEYNPVRIARFPIFVGTIISGLVVYDFIKGSRKNATRRKTSAQKSWFVIAIALVIVLMAVLSLASTCGSPIVFDSNLQVTRMEIAGTKWFAVSKDANIAVLTNGPQQMWRFEDYNFGVDSSPITKEKVERPPSHFGYDKYNKIAEALNFQDRYLVIFQLDKVAPMLFPENVRPKVHQYTEDDFVKLSFDPMAAKLYCNGEFEVWRIYGGR